MKAAKINIVDLTTQRSPESLVVKFLGVVTREEPPFIDGNNYFTGTPAIDRFASGTFGITVDNQKDWERAWSQLGHEPPGKLPRGAVAHLEFISVAGKNPDVSLAGAFKTDEGLRLNWNIAPDSSSQGESSGSFAVIILPGNLPLTSAYDYAQPARKTKSEPSI
jgi:hypothetical protein